MNIQAMGRIIRKRQQAETDDATISRMLENAGARSADFTERVPHRIAKRLLLQDKFFSHGQMLQYTAKSVGCGVYEVKAVKA
jgi:hypothetical protein